MPLVDTTYTFTNVKYNPSNLNLYERNLVGPITGLQSGAQQKWDVKNSNNQITVSHDLPDGTTSYVNVANTASQDVALEGSSNSYQWVAVPVPGLNNTYYFTTPDGKYTWYLTGSGDYAVIVLKKVAAPLDLASQWIATMAS